MSKLAEKTTVFGQPSWQIASSTMEACVTEQGGHVGPVIYDRKGRHIQPYSVAPWWNETPPAGLPQMLRVLRGDFFCMPFGANDVPHGKEKYPPHGETANCKWKFEEAGRDENSVTLHLSLKTKARPGRVDKTITLVDGHNAVYSRHIISGMTGPMSFGHHAMLKFPDQPGCGVLSTSPIQYGLVVPKPTEEPTAKGYSMLQTNAKFRSLSRVRTITGEYADLTRYPARRGFEDLAQIIAKPRKPFAWVAMTFPTERYVWFALKDPVVLKSTLFWMSNGGRYYAPWSGRHVNVLGIEDFTSYFHYGLAESARPNPISKAGTPTCAQLNPKKPTTINYIMAVAAIPKGFDRVKSISPAGREKVVVKAYSGAEITAPLDYCFLDSSVR
jgi:hypothetical protein